MSLEHRGEYPADWPDIAFQVKLLAGWRCVRCLHPFDPQNGRPLPCESCDTKRCRADRIAARHRVHGRPGGGHSLTVHHLDGDKSNVAWWNLPALCNSCHLSVQSRVLLEQGYLFDHSEWFLPYVAGYYAATLGLERTREEVEREPLLYVLAFQKVHPGTARPPPVHAMSDETEVFRSVPVTLHLATAGGGIGHHAEHAMLLDSHREARVVASVVVSGAQLLGHGPIPPVIVVAVIPLGFTVCCREMDLAIDAAAVAGLGKLQRALLSR